MVVTNMLVSVDKFFLEFEPDNKSSKCNFKETD